MLFTVAGCGSNQVQSTSAPTQQQQQQKQEVKLKTAEEISTALKEKALPIGTVVVYTAEKDTNKLLGRPNQYISKVNFADTTLEQSDPKDPKGGSVEYSYLNGPVLLRINKDLSPDKGAQYEKAFKELKIQ